MQKQKKGDFLFSKNENKNKIAYYKTSYIVLQIK